MHFTVFRMSAARGTLSISAAFVHRWIPSEPGIHRHISRPVGGVRFRDTEWTTDNCFAFFLAVVLPAVLHIFMRHCSVSSRCQRLDFSFPTSAAVAGLNRSVTGPALSIGEREKSLLSTMGGDMSKLLNSIIEECAQG
jgi:hypothetical protein